MEGREMDSLPESMAGSGTILTEKRRKLLLEGEMDKDLHDSNVRRHKMEIRDRFVDALVDLHIIAESMDLDDMQTLGETIAKHENQCDHPILAPAVSSLVSIVCFFTNHSSVAGAVSRGVNMSERRKAPEFGKIANVDARTNLSFGPGSHYDDPFATPEHYINSYIENEDLYNFQESLLLEKVKQEYPDLVERFEKEA